MNWLASNIIETILIIGIALLVIEIAVLGFSTFFLFFVGLAAVATSVVMWIGLIPESFVYAVFSVAVFTVVFAMLLWKKLAAMQTDVDTTRASSDLIGHSFVLPSDLKALSSVDEKPDYDFSGVTWKLNSHEDIVKGSVVEVVQIDVGLLTVKAK